MPDEPMTINNQVTTSPGWYRDIPAWARASLQIGFAGLIAVLFTMDSRDRTHQLQAFQEDSRQQAREDRTMFRDELRNQREELRNAVVEMRRAVDRLDDSQRAIKQDQRQIQAEVHTLKTVGPDAFKAPEPRSKE